MKIDFNDIELKALPEFKGGMGRMLSRGADDGKVKIMSNVLEPGCSIGRHTHDGTCEVIFITSGNALAIDNEGREEHLAPGDCTYCPEGQAHELRNAGASPLAFLAAVFAYPQP